MTASAWIEGLSEELWLAQFHQKCCGHAGKRYVRYIYHYGNKRSTILDGYEPTTKTAFEFCKYYFHNH